MNRNISLVSILNLLILSILLSGNLFDERLEIFDLGITISELNFFFFIVVYYFCLSKYKSNNIQIDKTFIFYNIFIVYLFINILVTNIIYKIPFNFYVFDKGFHSILVFPLLFSVFYLIDYKLLHNNLIFLLKSVLLVFLIAALIKVIINNGIPEGESGNRLSVFAGGPIVFARMMIVGSLLFYFVKDKFLFFPRWLSILITLLFLIMSIFSGSKFPILSFLFIVFLIFITSFKFTFKTFLIIILIILSIVVIQNYISNLLDLDISSLNRIFSIFLNDDISKLSSISAREEFNIASLKIFKDFVLFGCGFGKWGTIANYYYIFSEGYVLYLDYPHNFILEILSELGIVGFVLFILIFSSLRRLIDFKNPYFLIFLFYLLNSISSGDLMDFRFVFFWYFVYISYHKVIINENYTDI